MQSESRKQENGNGRAIDSPRKRPGVPQKAKPAPIGAAHWEQPSRQPVDDTLTKDAQREEWTATFGTGQPPKGISGALRRAAYGIPDYRVRRWLLLMIADRVDSLEWQLGRFARSPATWMLALGAAGATAAFAHHRAHR